MPVYRPPFPRSTPTHTGLIGYRQRRLYQELQLANANEEITTYDIASDSFIPWTRPVRVFGSGALTSVAASGFQNLSEADGYNPPICPHARDTSRDPKYSTMELNLRKKYQGRIVDFFQVPRSSHSCPFVVIVPPLHPPHFLYTQQEIDEHTSFQDEEEAAETREIYQYDLDFLKNFDTNVSSSPSRASTSSLMEVESMLLPAAGSSKSPFVSRSSSLDPSDNLFANAPSKNVPGGYNFNPRVSPSLRFRKQGPRPSPRIRLPEETRARLFFTEMIATARRDSDTALIDELVLQEKGGVFKENPSLHPAWDSAITCQVLQPYDEATYPGCSNAINQHLDFFDSELGRVIREFNSTLGVPRATFRALVDLGVKCNTCNCMFSPDGFNRHLVENRCGNCSPTSESDSMTLTPTDTDTDLLRSLKLRTFANRSNLNIQEFLENPVGVAFLEFNSKIGIPLDVWATITTAYIECPTCHLYRSFSGFRGHLGSSGVCEDLGEEAAVLVSGKGKQREV